MTQRTSRRGFYKNDRSLGRSETRLEAAFRQKYVYTASTDDTSTLAEVPDVVIIPNQDNSSTAIVLPLTYFDEDKFVEVVNRDATETVTVGAVSCAPGTTTTITFGGSSWSLFKVEANYESAASATVSRVATGTLSTGEILALNATPIVAIAAPGAGKTIVVDEVQLFLDYNSATYVAGAGEDLVLEYTTGSVAIMTLDSDADLSFLVASADLQTVHKPDFYNSDNAKVIFGKDLAGIDNDAVAFTILSGEVATGDSPIKYKITYHIVDNLT